MRSKLLDAVFFKNDNAISIVNTAMDIEVDWDCSLVKSNSQAEIDISINCVKGNFSYQNRLDSVETTTIVKFKTDDTWRLTHDKKEITLPVFPSSAIINLSLKTIKISF